MRQAKKFVISIECNKRAQNTQTNLIQFFFLTIIDLLICFYGNLLLYTSIS